MPIFEVQKLRSAMKEFLGDEPAFTNFTSQFQGCLDYLWYNDFLNVTDVAPLPQEGELRKYTALPSILHPSDHLPLCATFALGDSAEK